MIYLDDYLRRRDALMAKLVTLVVEHGNRGDLRFVAAGGDGTVSWAGSCAYTQTMLCCLLLPPASLTFTQPVSCRRRVRGERRRGFFLRLSRQQTASWANSLGKQFSRIHSFMTHFG